jgi:hypothetical protein
MKLIISAIFSCMISLGCEKENSKLKKLNDQSSLENHISNPPVTIHVSDIIDIRASDVYTSHHSIKRKIEFINRKSKEILDTFIISMIQTDTSKTIISSIKEKDFTGEFIIQSENLNLYIAKFEEGIAISNNLSKVSIKNIQPSRVNTCKFNLVHGCVSNEIRNMGIFEYGACLYAAPECYALLWAGCAFNYCITGEQK